MSQTEIAQVNRAFEEAARKGDMDRLASLYTPDAMVLAPDAPVVKGRDAIKQFWTSAAQQMGLKEVRLQTTDLQIAGDCFNSPRPRRDCFFLDDPERADLTGRSYVRAAAKLH